MSERIMMTRREIEYKLERRYTGRVITYTDIRDRKHCGKVHRISVESASGELMVIFILGTDKTRHECDIQYFFQNIVLHGNTPRTDTGAAGV